MTSTATRADGVSVGRTEWVLSGARVTLGVGDDYAYEVTTTSDTGDLDTTDGSDDIRDVRGMVANALRVVRSELMERADDTAKDELQDAIDLITATQGNAARLLAMLRANGF